MTIGDYHKVVPAANAAHVAYKAMIYTTLSSYAVGIIGPPDDGDYMAVYKQADQLWADGDVAGSRKLQLKAVGMEKAEQSKRQREQVLAQKAAADLAAPMREIPAAYMTRKEQAIRILGFTTLVDILAGVPFYLLGFAWLLIPGPLMLLVMFIVYAEWLQRSGRSYGNGAETWLGSGWPVRWRDYWAANYSWPDLDPPKPYLVWGRGFHDRLHARQRWVTFLRIAELERVELGVLESIYLADAREIESRL